MSTKDYKQFIATLNKQKEEILASPAARLKYLQSIGILTKSGKVSSNFKELCTPKGQA